MASMAGVTPIDGCPGVTLGPQKTPADKMAFASNEPQGQSVPPRPRQEKQGREGKMPIVSVDGPRSNGKTHKMPERGLTPNLIGGGLVLVIPYSASESVYHPAVRNSEGVRA
jgi:hypothetical protein